MADNGSNSGKGEIEVGKLVAGGFTVITAATALVGGATGAASRFIRNDPKYVVLAVILSLTAVGLALVASQVSSAPAVKETSTGQPHGNTPPNTTPPHSARPHNTTQHSVTPHNRAEKFLMFLRHRGTWKFILTFLSFVVFASAAVVTVQALTDSLASSDRPRIAGSWALVNGQPTLSLTVMISGMKISDTLNVSVRAVRTGATNANQLGPSVFTSQTGADAAGDGNLSIAVPLPSGFDALQVVANLGSASVTCDGIKVLTPASPSPKPIPTGKTPVPVSSAPNNVNKPVFSCVTITAPTATPTPSPSV